MAFWRNLFGFLGGAASRQKGLQNSSPSYYSKSAATPVTMDTALQISAVFACVRLITETVGSLPLRIYDVRPDGTKVLNTTHRLATLLNGRPNRWQTRQEMIETLVYQYVMLGNFYAVKQMGSMGQLVGIIPLMTQQMEVELTDETGSIAYKYTSSEGVRFYAQGSIWHGKLFGNGIIGLSPLAYARNSIGIGQAAEEAVTKIYANGSKPSGVLSLDKLLTPEQRDKIRQNFAGLTEGEDNRLFVLEAGAKYQQVSLSPQDIELLASRRFQIEDIARFFGVPSVLINDTSASTTWGSGVQQIVEGWYKLGLRPMLTRIQDSMRMSLLDVSEQQSMTIEFDLDDLLMPSMADRISMGKEAVTGGLMASNEWRKEQGMPPKPGGDDILVQQQMVPITMVGQIQRGSSGGRNEQA